jgi:hypothetical protein
MTEHQEFISKLAEGYSTQAKTTNKFWLVLIVASIIALVGRIDSEKLIDLPFTLGKVQIADFYTIIIILISAVVIVFSASMAQTMRTRLLIQKAIDNLPETEKFIAGIHIQDYFDSMVSPTYMRVAPISQFLFGKKQFFGSGDQSKLIKYSSSVLYILLKLTTFVFLYILPALAIKKCWQNKSIGALTQTLHIPDFYLHALTFFAGLCMLIMFFGDIKNIIGVLKRLFS